ncbi:MAG: hypothetical protein FD127_4494 [Acidimicrobiaceae bacterium]|nr:MAG: hypothetical protein FD127_4494 [Acidimicrobiaceae bacterium]
MPDYSIGTVERSDTSGTWAGSLLYATGEVLAFGYGAENLVTCDDSALDGDPACAAISGLPNQASRGYFDAAVTSGGGLALLGTTCTGGLCLSGSHYLTVCPAGADPTMGSNWREFFLGSFTFMGGTNTYASEVAASADTIMVLGTRGGVPYVWTWSP